MNLFRFKHACESFLKIRPYEIWLPILNFNFLGCLKSIPLQINLNMENFLYLCLVNPKIFRKISLIRGKKLNIHPIVIITIRYNRKFPLRLQCILGRKKPKLNPASSIHFHDFYLCILVHNFIKILWIRF